MKIEPKIRFLSPETSLAVFPDGEESAALFCRGRKVISLGRVKIGKFDEAAGLAEKLRRHLADDRLSAEADAVNVIPFGCEYHVERHWKFAGNTVELVSDLRADHGGNFRDTELALETVRFPGETAGVDFLLRLQQQRKQGHRLRSQ